MRPILGAAAAAVVTAALAATLPSVAAADSIAYVKSGDLWLSTTVGARQVRVTTTGGYTDVTQADDGTLVGLHGVRLRRLDRGGRVLADFDTRSATRGPRASAPSRARSTLRSRRTARSSPTPTTP
jgi:hypothetical protein